MATEWSRELPVTLLPPRFISVIITVSDRDGAARSMLRRRRLMLRNNRMAQMMRTQITTDASSVSRLRRRHCQGARACFDLNSILQNQMPTEAKFFSARNYSASCGFEFFHNESTSDNRRTCSVRGGINSDASSSVSARQAASTRVPARVAASASILLQRLLRLCARRLASGASPASIFCFKSRSNNVESSRKKSTMQERRLVSAPIRRRATAGFQRLPGLVVSDIASSPFPGDESDFVISRTVARFRDC